jgi:hypothetical protein
MAFWNARPPVERTRAGFRINLEAEERQLLIGLFGQLRDLLVSTDLGRDGVDGTALRRLFPRAYHLPEHAEHDAEYQRLMREDLVASRLAGIETVVAALEAEPPLTEEQVLAFSQALNGVRLVLGTLLDVDEELDLDDVAEDDPRLGEHQLYGFLSWLLEWTVRSLSR